MTSIVGVLVAAACGNGPATSSGLTAGIDPCADIRALELLPTTTFVRSTGAPRELARTIDVPFDGAICIRIETGGNPRLRSASVSFDGSPLITPSALREERIAVPLDVSAGEHRLEVELRSAPGAVLRVGIRGLPGPGIAFESLPDTGGDGFAVAEAGVAQIGFTVVDVLGHPVPGAAVEIEAGAMPIEGSGIALRDPAIDASVFVGSAPGGPRLSLGTDAGGHARLEAQPRSVGGYQLDIYVSGQSWLPRSSAYLEATPSPGSWRDYGDAPPDGPETRENASVMFDAARRRVLLFGGEHHIGPADVSVPPTPREALVDVWSASLPADPALAPSAWRPVTVSGATVPPAVLGASAVYMPRSSSIIVVTSTGDAADTLAVWRFAQDGSTGTWSQLSLAAGPDNELPVPIPAHHYGSAVYDPVHQRVILFGGLSSDHFIPGGPIVTGPFGGPVTSDVLFIDIDQVDPSRAVVTGRRAPAALAARRQAMLVFDETRNRLVLWGGADGGSAPEISPETMLDDAWQLSFVAEPLGVWSALTQVPDPLGGLPTARSRATVGLDVPRERAIMYGGLTNAPDPAAYATGDEVWEMGLAEPGRLAWRRLAPGGATPAARHNHGAGGVFAAEAARMVVFGGCLGIFEGGLIGGVIWCSGQTSQTIELQWDHRPRFGGVQYAQATPSVIINDDVDSAQVEVRWLDSIDVISATARLLQRDLRIGAVRGTGASFIDVPLYDDGTHGDRVAGDGVFSVDEVAYSGAIDPSTPPNGNRLGFTIVGTRRSGGTELVGVELRTVSRESVTAVPVPGDPDVMTTPNAIFIADRTRRLFDNYRNVPDPRTVEFDSTVARIMTRTAGAADLRRFELAQIVIARDAYHTGGAYFVPASRYVKTPAALNIGLVPGSCDIANWYCCGVAPPVTCGSCASCESLRRIITGTFVRTAQVHEIGHEWGPRFGSTYAPSLSDGHWRMRVGSFGSMQPHSVDFQSVMSASTACLTSLTESPCTFTTGSCSSFDEYDLYLMGILPSSALPDARVVFHDFPTGPGPTYLCSSVTTIPAADLVAFEGGERVPDASSAVRDFDLAVIVVSPEAFTEAEIIYYDRLARWYATGEPGTFSAATGGAMTLRTAL